MHENAENPGISCTVGGNICYEFVVFKEMGLKPVIRKTYKNVQTQILEVDLTTDEIELLSPNDNVEKVWHWGLISHIGKDFSTIAIPGMFEKPPKFIVYPGLDICGEDPSFEEESQEPETSPEEE